MICVDLDRHDPSFHLSYVVMSCDTHRHCCKLLQAISRLFRFSSLQVFDQYLHAGMRQQHDQCVNLYHHNGSFHLRQGVLSCDSQGQSCKLLQAINRLFWFYRLCKLLINNFMVELGSNIINISIESPQTQLSFEPFSDELCHSQPTLLAYIGYSQANLIV